MRILILSSVFPYPPMRGGTEIRTFYLMQFLRQQGHAVILFTQRSPDDVTDVEVAQLRGLVDELQVFPLPPSPRNQTPLSKGLRFAQSWLTSTPPNVLHRYSPALRAAVDAQVSQGQCDAITCEHSVNEIYVRPQFRHLTTLVNIHSSVYGVCQHQLAQGVSQNARRDRLYLSLLKRYERRYCQKFSEIVVTTEDDRAQILELSPQSSVHVIPNGVNLEQFTCRTQDPSGQTLVYVGAMNVLHNIDAVTFFCREVLPALQQSYPATKFLIVGTKPTAEVRQLADLPGVSVTGQVPDVVPYLHAATVCVVPIRTGYGIKNKTLEAMAAGVPVVSSDRGLEGLAVEHPVRALRANTVMEYVSAIGRLFEDAALRALLSVQGRQFVEEQYTWEQMGRCYEAALFKPQMLRPS